MTSKEEFEQTLQHIEKAHLHLENVQAFKYLDDTSDIITEIQEKIRIELGRQRQENQELERQLDADRAKEQVLAREYNSIMENNKSDQEEYSRQEVLIQLAVQKQADLENEIIQLERELNELDKSDDGEAEVDIDQLQIAIYRGLGIEAKVEGDKVEKLILTTPNNQDIRTVSLYDNSVEFTANYIWNFISK